MSASSVIRGCGTRQPGGAYLVTSLSSDGVPLEDLIIDPPVPVDPEALGLAKVGMALAETPEGGTAVLDWVGAQHYPNVADFVEEAAAFGTSRRVPTTFDFAKLGPGAQHLLVHPRASVLTAAWPLEERAFDWVACQPSFLARALTRRRHPLCPFKGDHPGHEMCAALWWELLDPATLKHASLVAHFEAQVQREAPVLRHMPSLSYLGYSLPDADVWAPGWRPAVFMRLPITRVEVVRDPGDMAHEITLPRARRAHIPVVEVDE